MGPQRARNLGEDSKLDAFNTKERHAAIIATSTTSKGRRTGNTAPFNRSTMKDVSTASQNVHGQVTHCDDAPKMDWAWLDTSILHAYRQSHLLDYPSAFSNSYDQRMLARSGIGLLSPTMARHKSRQRVTKEQLATAVRKDFNAAMINEPDTITSFIYAVHNQGRLLD